MCSHRFYEGQRVRLTRDLEELRAGMVGIVRLAGARLNGSSTDGVEFDEGLHDEGLHSVALHRRMDDGQGVRVIDYVKAVDDRDTQEIDVEAVLASLPNPEPIPEPPVLDQAIIGFMSELIWLVESQSLQGLTPQQSRVLGTVRSVVRDELGIETKNAAD